MRTFSSAVEAQGLTVHFGGLVAVDRVDLQVDVNELRCLVGPNGAGKSTLFKVLTGQLKPSAGSVHILGRDTARMHRHQIACLGVGVKTQVPSVFEGLTVAQSLHVAAARHAERDAEALRIVDELLEQLRLGAVRDMILARLSHGQRQWVELAMVLATAPALVLLDEPVAGMSDEETQRTIELLREVRRGRAIVVVEHDMRFVREIADRVTVLHRGTVLCEGHVQEVLSSPVVRDVYLGHGRHGT